MKDERTRLSHVYSVRGSTEASERASFLSYLQSVGNVVVSVDDYLPLSPLPPLLPPPPPQRHSAPTNKVICACTTTHDSRLRRRRLYPLAVAVTAPLSALPPSLSSFLSPFFPCFSVPPRSRSSSLSYIIGMVSVCVLAGAAAHHHYLSLTPIERTRERMKPSRSAVFPPHLPDQRRCVRAHFLASVRKNVRRRSYNT